MGSDHKNPVADETSARSGGEQRIAFRIDREVVLDELWFDPGWYEGLLADGKTTEEALRSMVEEAMREDAISVIWEAFGPGPELASEFAKSVTDLRIVSTQATGTVATPEDALPADRLEKP